MSTSKLPPPNPASLPIENHIQAPSVQSSVAAAATATAAHRASRIRRSRPHPMDQSSSHSLAPMRSSALTASHSMPQQHHRPQQQPQQQTRNLADLAMPPTGMHPSVSGGMYTVNAMPAMPQMDYSQHKQNAVPTSYVNQQSLPPVPGVGGTIVPGRGNGLDYAVMRKEKAREEYKERRRLELLATGEVDRTKRRKKNDTSMSENQKYHRRLKMNQDSAAAARHAQEVYVETLEKLVETTEAEKSILSIQALNLRTERDELMRRVDLLQHQLQAAAAAEGSQAQGTENSTGNGEDRGNSKRSNQQAQLDLKAVLELMDASNHNHGAPTEFRNSGVYPPRAV